MFCQIYKSSFSRNTYTVHGLNFTYYTMVSKLVNNLLELISSAVRIALLNHR